MTLRDFFQENPKVALAFSGGVDSAYLLYAAMKYGADVCAFYVKTDFQPQFETDDAVLLAEQLNANLQILYKDVLDNKLIISNPPDRCYYCKKTIFAEIAIAAAANNYLVVIDGTNASDDISDRPGMQALRELSVRSPLRECGLTKEKIRQLSKDAGLFTWNKPAYACLATRVPAGERITAEKLRKTEIAEDYLFSMGFTDFRVRMIDDCARIQIPEHQIPLLLSRRQEILNELKKYYNAVTLDLEVR